MRKKVSLGKKSVLVILVLALVLTAAAVLNSYRIYAETMDKHYQMLAVDVARTAAGLVDPGWVGTYRDEVLSLIHIYFHQLFCSGFHMSHPFFQARQFSSFCQGEKSVQRTMYYWKNRLSQCVE